MGIKPVNVSVRHVSSTTNTPQTQTRTVDQVNTDRYYEIHVKGKVQVLTDYVTTYAMPTAEGALTSHSIAVEDGNESVGYTGCLVDKCTLTIERHNVLMADLIIKATGNEAKDLSPTDETETSITKAGVTTLTLGGAAISKWTEFSWGVDNHVELQGSGTADTISDIYGKEATYSGNIKFVKNTNVQYTVATGTKALVITITDNQSVPVATTFTFAACGGKTDDTSVAELGLFTESLDWDAAGLVIS